VPARGVSPGAPDPPLSTRTVPMQKASFVAGLLALAAFSAVPGAAQAVRPTGEVFDTRGFSLGMHLSNNRIDTPGTNRITPGGGLGITLGYGINERVQAFVRASSGYRNAQVDLGARYRFGRPGQALRPYAEVAVSRLNATRDTGGELRTEPFGPSVHSVGYGLTAGAGMEYVIGPRLGLDLGLVHTRGYLNRPLDDYASSGRFSATRVRLGVTWRP
jgi:opacity protein-like surface antigen